MPEPLDQLLDDVKHQRLVPARIHKLAAKEDTGTVIINGQKVGDSQLEFVTDSTSGS